MKRRRTQPPGRPKMFGEDMRLTNFRFPKTLLDEMEEARFALEKASLAELVRDALRDYLTKHRPVIDAVRRAKAKHGGDAG